MDKNNYQKPSMKEVMIEDCLLQSDSNGTSDDPHGNTRVSRDFGEEE